jgi:hypothetical protein
MANSWWSSRSLTENFLGRTAWREWFQRVETKERKGPAPIILPWALAAQHTPSS